MVAPFSIEWPEGPIALFAEVVLVCQVDGCALGGRERVLQLMEQLWRRRRRRESARRLIACVNSATPWGAEVRSAPRRSLWTGSADVAIATAARSVEVVLELVARVRRCLPAVRAGRAARRSERSKDLEILVLRHELSILRRTKT
jgi:hypothetical protein